MDQIASVIHVIDEKNILIFLLQFFLLLGTAKLIGVLFIKLKQPTVTADMIAGIILGPTILGRLAPSLAAFLFPRDSLQISMMDTVAWIGIFFLLLVTGLGVNFSSLWRQKGKAAWIAISDIIIPIAISAAILAFLPSRFIPDPSRKILFILFISSIMTISALPVSIRVMQDLKLLRTDLGFLTISALSINDITGWVVFTLILGIFAHGKPDLLYILSLIFFSILFMVLSLTVARKAVGALISEITKRTSDPSGYVLTVISMTGLAFGAITQRIGIQALFGFFLAGLIVGESKDLSEKVRSTIENFVYAVFVPIFFANIGLKIDIFRGFDFFLVSLFTAMGIIARFTGAWVGVLSAGIPRAQRWPVSILHTPGGKMHIVIGALALELNLITEDIFVAIIAAAILSSVVLGPWLSFVLKKVAPKETVQIPSGATLNLSSSEKYPALKELCMKAGSITGMDGELIYQTAKTREEGMSTGIEKGIAIPHARLTGAPGFLVVFGRSEFGIDWNSPDGVPARLFFFVLSAPDETDIQLRVYRQILEVLSEDETIASLLRAKSVRAATELLNDRLRVSAITR